MSIVSEARVLKNRFPELKQYIVNALFVGHQSLMTFTSRRVRLQGARVHTGSVEYLVVVEMLRSTTLC